MSHQYCTAGCNPGDRIVTLFCCIYQWPLLIRTLLFRVCFYLLFFFPYLSLYHLTLTVFSLQNHKLVIFCFVQTQGFPMWYIGFLTITTTPWISFFNPLYEYSYQKSSSNSDSELENCSFSKSNVYMHLKPAYMKQKMAPTVATTEHPITKHCPIC